MSLVNELRIGNYIQRCGVIFRITTQYIHWVAGGEGNKTFAPLKLSEEILLKCGFVPNPYQDRYELNDLHFEIDKSFGGDIIWSEKYPHIKYLHQLQNLYFWITGKELEVSL